MTDVTALSTLPVKQLSDLQAIGHAIAQSGMFGVRNDASGLVVAATCHQQGITLMDFQRTYHIIDGRPSMRADAMLAEFRKLGGKCKLIENTAERAAAEFTFEDQSHTFEYTLDDAKRTGDALKGDGSLKSMWQKRPDDMLWARLVSRSVRRLAPEICAGLYTPEETQDFTDRAQRSAQPISPDDAIKRAADAAKPVDPEYETYDAATEPIPLDPSLCPIGGPEYIGQPWADMTTKLLEMAFDADDPAMTQDHRDYIASILLERKDHES